MRLTIDPATVTSKLSFVQRQLVELAKVLTLEERISGDLVILLDEPTSVLDKEEVALLFQIVRDLRSRAGFVFVSHRLDEVIELSDRIYVMKDGEVADVVDDEMAEIEDIQHKMVGRSINKEYYREDTQKPYDTARVLLELDNIGHAGKYRRISFKLHAGEVLALVGVEGSGREAILRTIFGLQRPHIGSITVKGEKILTNSASAGVRRGIGYVPRERKIEGIVGGLSIYENMTLSQMPRYSRAGVLKIADERARARDWIRKLSIKASSETVDCGNLSGGNQQKVVLAKWRSGGSDIILLDHPTRGLDIGAKEDVYDMVREMCEAGCGVVLIADTLEEAIGLAHTIAVIKDGEIQEWFHCRPGAKPSLYDLIHHMV